MCYLSIIISIYLFYKIFTRENLDLTISSLGLTIILSFFNGIFLFISLIGCIIA
jgi:hypothetical protein